MLAPRSARNSSTRHSGIARAAANPPTPQYRIRVRGSVYAAGRPVMSQYFFGGAVDGGAAILVYVAALTGRRP